MPNNVVLKINQFGLYVNAWLTYKCDYISAGTFRLLKLFSKIKIHTFYPMVRNPSNIIYITMNIN